MGAIAMPSADGWMMGGSKDPDLQRVFGISEDVIASMAVEAVFYAQDKAGRSRQRFVCELVQAFEAQLYERLGVELDS